MPIDKKLRSVLLLVFVFACAESVNLTNRHLFAKDSPPQDSLEKTLEDTAVVSDLSAEQLAREILILQQQMGGSIVKDQVLVPPLWQSEKDANKNALITDQHQNDGWAPYPAVHPTPVDDQVQKVAELRDAAFTLDTTAHRLEQLDLYEQADSLRNVATRLRRDARELKQQARAASPATSRFPTPGSSTAVPGQE